MAILSIRKLLLDVIPRGRANRTAGVQSQYFPNLSSAAKPPVRRAYQQNSRPELGFTAHTEHRDQQGHLARRTTLQLSTVTLSPRWSSWCDLLPIGRKREAARVWILVDCASSPPAQVRQRT
jgi:hypothetical protein